MLKRLALALFAACLAGPAMAQTAPYVHGTTIGTSQVQVLPLNPQRRKVFFYNPNASATIAFCPAGPNRDTGAVTTCVINGPGSVTLPPYNGLVLEGGLPNGVPLSMGNAWNGIASTGGSAYTILEFE